MKLLTTKHAATVAAAIPYDPNDVWAANIVSKLGRGNKLHNQNTFISVFKHNLDRFI